MMIKLWIVVLIGIFVFIMLGQPSIKFNPFEIAFPRWKISIAWILLTISIVLFSVQGHQDGRKDAFNEIYDEITKAESKQATNFKKSK